MKNLPISSMRAKWLLFAALFALLTLSVAADLFLNIEALSEQVRRSIVLYIRLPRVCACLAVGAGLAVSGVIIQSVFYNPLASPNVIGVNAAAGCAVTLAAALAPSLLLASQAAAFAGAFGGVTLVLLISEKTGASRMTMILAGVAVSAVFSAITDAVITFFPDALMGYSNFKIGGVANLTMGRVAPTLILVPIVIIITLTLSNHMDVLMLGDDSASSLGLAVKRTRFALLALAAALAGASVSTAGQIGFVGLIVPHIVRRTLGADSKTLVAGSAVCGALLMTACDLLSRSIFRPYELPVGIILSLLGGPFFIFLLFRQRGGRTRD